VPKPIRNSPLLRRIGARARKARIAKGLSQEKVAFDAELDRSYVSGLERGEFNVSVLKLAQIAKVLGIRLSSLLDGE
jgi:transcriptional regulator with XRE-family HTH domain